uniref:15.3 kDa putative secreted protein n=1 Tax=Argas monolakensis TaxID=34602 RepID=Q09JN8_ARGMO|nr:15.3 kDa putative secreted protein [Argas monolakensis]
MESMKVVLMLLALSQGALASDTAANVTTQKCGGEWPKFTSFALAGCTQPPCDAATGYELRLRFGACYNATDTLQIYVYASVKQGNYTQMYRSTCNEAGTGYPCSVRGQQNFTGYVHFILNDQLEAGTRRPDRMDPRSCLR